MCFDSLSFYSENKFREYYCDTNEHAVGTYMLSNDTLTLIIYYPKHVVLNRFPNIQLSYNKDNNVAVYTVEYIFEESNKLVKIYFEDILMGYKTDKREEYWRYMKIK